MLFNVMPDERTGGWNRAIITMVDKDKPELIRYSVSVEQGKLVLHKTEKQEGDHIGYRKVAEWPPEIVEAIKTLPPIEEIEKTLKDLEQEVNVAHRKRIFELFSKPSS